VSRRKGEHPLTTARRVNRAVGLALGDAQAARRGRLGERVVNRLIGKALARAMRGVWR
jgi:hypothetical protein